jgi:hypothetical protein
MIAIIFAVITGAAILKFAYNTLWASPPRR